MRKSIFLLTPLREGRPELRLRKRLDAHFYSRPCGRGDSSKLSAVRARCCISTHAPAGGATLPRTTPLRRPTLFLLTPLREGRPGRTRRNLYAARISTHAPAGGATLTACTSPKQGQLFLLTPLREGRLDDFLKFFAEKVKFLLTPLREGRRSTDCAAAAGAAFLLTPLREGRPAAPSANSQNWTISTHAPAGGATLRRLHFLAFLHDFYSRPCGRGDVKGGSTGNAQRLFLLTPLREGRRSKWQKSWARLRTFLLTPLREGRPGS